MLGIIHLKKYQICHKQPLHIKKEINVLKTTHVNLSHPLASCSVVTILISLYYLPVSSYIASFFFNFETLVDSHAVVKIIETEFIHFTHSPTVAAPKNYSTTSQPAN